jgi:peptide/nickel transport system substrate-binding protein
MKSNHTKILSGKPSRFFVLAIFASLILSACAGVTQSQLVQPEQTLPPEQGALNEPKILTILYTQEFDTLAPYFSDMWFSRTTWQLWNVWAWEFDENNEPFPVLVTDIPSMKNGGISKDGKTITMKLREDIKWSDGSPITAEDFIFTYEMVTNPKNSVSSAYPYDKLERLEAPDSRTVVMTFKEIFTPWLATFWRGLLPEHILKPVFEKEGTLDNAGWNRKPAVGSGPYVFAEWKEGSYVRFVANENYWLNRPKIDEIVIRFVPDDTSQVNALQTGDGDLGAFIAINDIPILQRVGIKILTVPTANNEGWFFLINEEKGNPALLDVKVRKAIALAFDRETLNKRLHLVLTRIPASYWDSLPYYNDPPVEDFPYDPEQAKALLDQAGWKDTNGDGVRDKDGVELVLTYGTSIREIRQDTQAFAQQQLAQVGIKLNLLTYEPDLFFAGYTEGGPAATGEIDIMQWSDGPTGFPDPDVYYWLCSEIPSDENPQGTNWFYRCDPELDELIQLQARQVNLEERQETISKINQLIHDKVYWIGLWQDPDIWALRPRLKNVTISSVTPYSRITEWDISP